MAQYRKFIFVFFALICYHQHVESSEDTKLIFVQILYRHGDRSPIELYPTDPNPASVWPEGLGKLTKLGRKQHYALGKYFRNRYRDFITTSPLEINITSSDVDRCMKSALSNLASFYAPDPKWQFENDLPWQPLQVYYIPKIQDKYLEVDSYCPRATEEQRRIVLSSPGQTFIKEHWEMFENITYNSGNYIANWTEASYFHDVILIERKYNFTIPSWVMPWWDELEYVSNMAFYLSFSTPLVQRLRAGPLLGQIIQRMNSKLSGDLLNQKIHIYSSHDTNVAVVLNALKLFNMKAPPYCASIIFELHEMNGTHVVRLLYLNSTNPVEKIDPPHVLVLDGCQEFCPLDYFVNFTRDLIPENWDKECELDQTFIEKIQDTSTAMAIFVAAITVIILALGIYSIWRLHNRGSCKKLNYEAIFPFKQTIDIKKQEFVQVQKERMNTSRTK